MLVLGDDNAMALPDCYKHVDFNQGFLRLGFKSEGAHCTILDIEFCSMRLYPVVGGYVFGPKLGKLFSKLGFFINPPMSVHPKSILRGTYLSLATVASFCEPFDIMFRHVLSLTSGADAYYPARGDWQMSLSASLPDTRTFDALSQWYGWSASMAAQFRAELSGTVIGSQLHQGVLKHIIACDLD